ncbi:MAG: hypothetical protein OEZ25_00140 [Candidatus Bathyarchaeota archaeon]|nr:hypothetical protein [Candidatus Bathyarchaeota archaeon]
MKEIRDVAEAMNRAKEFIMGKHRKVKRILIRVVRKEGDLWLVEGALWFSRVFFTVKRSFRLLMRSENGEVVSYEEAPFRAREGYCSS